MKKTFLVGKIGKSTTFIQENQCSSGGDRDAPLLIKKIAELNPESTFILIGKMIFLKLEQKVYIYQLIYTMYMKAQ